MKKHIIVNFILFLFLFIVIAFVFLINRNPKEKKLASKTEQEITQLEDKVIAMMNQLNKISFSNFVLVEGKTPSSDNQTSQER